MRDGHSANSTNFDDLTPLHIACLHGRIKCVELLLSYGARVNARSIDASTPLCDACAGGHADCVRLLLKNGAEVNPSLLLSSPLHEASLKGNKECVQLLIKAGAQLNAMDCNFGTPLHAATFMNHAECAEILLRAGAIVNATKIHQTPLHLAASYDDFEVAKVLIDYGANVLALDNQNKKPRDLLHQQSGLFYEELLRLETAPRTLKELCRHVLRVYIDPRNLKNFVHQFLPTPLASYINDSGL